MGASQDVFVLPVIFNLCCASEPVAEAHDGSAGGPEVPAVHETVDRACREHVRLVRGEIDVCDCTGVGVEDELDGSARREREVPDDSFLVRR